MKIIKLGGSVFSDKTVPNSLHSELLSDIIGQIVRASHNMQEHIILIHGGGSFGHPPASRYKINDGRSALVTDQTFGLGLTQRKMVQLNGHIMDLFLKFKLPSISLQPSGVFIKTGEEVTFFGVDHIESLLKMEILPILYGDILLDASGNFSILSGDDIIFHLCKDLVSYDVVEIIFCISEDGLYLPGNTGEQELVRNIHVDKLDSLEFSDETKKIDVTGGMEHKLRMIQKICRLGKDVILINGQKENLVYEALMGKKIPSTRFYY